MMSPVGHYTNCTEIVGASRLLSTLAKMYETGKRSIRILKS